MATLPRVLLALAALAFTAAVGLCGWLFLYTGDLPKIDQLSEFAPKADGHRATDACLAGPSFAIPFDRIGKPFQDALTSAEPSDTYAYEIARTLTCNKHESPAKYQLSVFRLSWHIRRRFSGQELLTIYTNRAYFGPAAIGVDNASHQFFEKEANALSVGEAALLAGVLRGPAIYSPFKDSDLALRRRNQVLETMAAQGKLSATELTTAVATPIGTRMSRAHEEPSDLPESIAKAMFPNAPDNRQDIDCFRSLTLKMSVNDVVQKCGRPDEELGSGLYIFVWHMPDGSAVSIGTPYLDSIGPVRFIDSSGKTTVLPRKK